MSRRWLCAGFVLLAAPLAPAQTLAEMTATLASAETVDDAMVGDDGHTSGTYRVYVRWRDRATDDELRGAVRHAAPNVRAYAVRALVERETVVDWPALLRDFLADTAMVTTCSGCCQAHEKVGDVVFETVRPRLTEEQLQDFAEALIRGQSPLYAREWALRTLRLRDGMLHPVRTLAKAGDAPAAIALARYGLQADAPILAALLRDDGEPFDENAQFLAAEIHRGPALLAPLLALDGAAKRRIGFDHPYRLRFWLQAIAAQRSAAAGAFLDRFLREVHPDSDHKEQDLVKTMAETIAPYAEVEAFAAVRAEVERRQAAQPR